MTTTTTPNVPLPAGFESLLQGKDEWDADRRMLVVGRYVCDGRLDVSAEAWQQTDGTICNDRRYDVGIVLIWDGTQNGIRLSATEARETAAALLELADIVDGLA